MKVNRLIYKLSLKALILKKFCVNISEGLFSFFPFILLSSCFDKALTIADALIVFLIIVWAIMVFVWISIHKNMCNFLECLNLISVISATQTKSGRAVIFWFANYKNYKFYFFNLILKKRLKIFYIF